MKTNVDIACSAKMTLKEYIPIGSVVAVSWSLKKNDMALSNNFKRNCVNDKVYTIRTPEWDLFHLLSSGKGFRKQNTDFDS